MTKYEIVEELAKKGHIERMVHNAAKTSAPELDDLSQEIYEILLNMDEDKLIDLYEKGRQLDYWIARIIMNQYISDSSPFHYRYRKFRNMTEGLREIHNEITDEVTWMQEVSRKKCEY